MHQNRFLLSLFLSAALSGQATLAANLTADQAKDHIGETATVCGVVAGMHYAGGSNNRPTVVNLDKPYPHQVFTVLIWGEDLAKFQTKPNTWEHKRICSTGAISLYHGTAEMVVKSPDQISIQK